MREDVDEQQAEPGIGRRDERGLSPRLEEGRDDRDRPGLHREGAQVQRATIPERSMGPGVVLIGCHRVEVAEGFRKRTAALCRQIDARQSAAPGTAGPRVTCCWQKSGESEWVGFVMSSLK